MKLLKSALGTSVGLSLLSCLISALPLEAQNAGAGTSLFDFLNVNYDAQSVALSGATVALPNDLYGILSNPAALGFFPASQAFVGYRPLGAGVYGAPLAYALPKGDKGVFAVSLAGLTSGQFEGTDNGPDGAPKSIGPVRADFWVGNIAWAKKISDFCASAIVVKGLYNYMGSSAEHYSADGVAFDGGFQCRFMNSRLIYGFVARNIGFPLSGYTKDEHYPLPTAAEIGVSYVPRYIDALRLAFDINKKRGDYLTFSPGAEFEIIKNQMVVRGGYSFSYRDLLYCKDFLTGETDSTYIKSNRTTLCLGAGFMTELMARKVKFDAAIEFADAQSLPVLVISMLTNI